MNKPTRHPSRWLIVSAGIGCAAGLLAWPATPQLRFLAVLIGVVSPVACYCLVRLLAYLVVQLRAVRHRNWRQFGLRELLFFTVLCAVGTTLWQRTWPDVQRKRFAAEVTRLSGSFSPGYAFFIRVPITDADLANLAGLPAADEIIVIRLERTLVSEDGLIALSGFPNLSTVLLSECQLSDRALAYLTDLPKLKHVVLLNNPRITETAIAELKESRPELSVVSAFDFPQVEFVDPSNDPSQERAEP